MKVIIEGMQVSINDKLKDKYEKVSGYKLTPEILEGFLAGERPSDFNTASKLTKCIEDGIKEEIDMYDNKDVILSSIKEKING